MKHSAHIPCLLLRLAVAIILCCSLIPITSLQPVEPAYAASTYIVNGNFSYGASSLFSCNTTSGCQWLYVDLNNAKYATGKDTCPIHGSKHHTWQNLPSGCTVNGFGWKSNQAGDSSSKWSNGVVAQVANCIELQREKNGNVYAELTAHQENTFIYQDISTEPGAIYKWTLKHSSRGNTHVDTMQVMIGSTSSQTAQNATRTTVNGLGNKTGSVGTVISTPNNKAVDTNGLINGVPWETYTGTYVVPSGQTTTRFTFKALSSASSNSGNLVDDISFSRSYALNYDFNGGSANGIYTDAKANNYAGYHVEGSSVNLTTTKPTRAGYTFLGWSRSKINDVTSLDAYNSAKSKFVTSFTMPSTATTVYAVWAKNPVATFTDGMGNTLKTQTVTFASGASAPNAPTRTGYQFASWNKAFNALYSDTRIDAQWSPNLYRIVFDANSGEGTMETQTLTFDAEAPLAQNQFFKLGYLFSGWKDARSEETRTYADAERVMNLSAVQNDTITLYAQWEPVGYQVQFDSNGACDESPIQDFTYDEPQTLASNTFAKEGYRWMQWNTEINGTGDMFYNEQLVANLAEQAGDTVLLFSQWAANRTMIVYEPNEGEGTMQTQWLAYDTPEALAHNAFEREGYTFLGWNTLPDGSGTAYFDEQEVSDLSSDHDVTITLYAQWEANEQEDLSDEEDVLPEGEGGSPSPGDPQEPTIDSPLDSTEEQDLTEQPNETTLVVPSEEDLKLQPDGMTVQLGESEQPEYPVELTDELTKPAQQQAVLPNNKQEAGLSQTGKSLMGVQALLCAPLIAGIVLVCLGMRKRYRAIRIRNSLYARRRP